MKKDKVINESSLESFPASDAPAWAGAHDNEPIDLSRSSESDIVISESLQTLTVDNVLYYYYSLPVAEKIKLPGIHRLPFTLKILLENLLRHQDGKTVTFDDIQAMVEWLKHKSSHREIAYRPTRVLMQDFTGVPAVVDLAAMREAIKKLGGDPECINPLSAVDLVIDHSIQVDEFIVKDAFNVNAKLEMERNYERYEFLRWGQNAFQNFKVVPPDTGICHQVNLEYLAKVVWRAHYKNQQTIFPDTLVGTDSHTTMINGLGVLGWGVGGIEAEAAMLGQPISMLIPEVIGVKLTGKLTEGITATDLVLTVTHLLRKKGVVGKFIEFFGPGLIELSIADRATIANMSPEYGATCGFFPIDEETLNYLSLSGRDPHTIHLVEAYAKAQGLWHIAEGPYPEFSDILELDLTTIKSSVAGPKRPQDRIELPHIKAAVDKLLEEGERSLEKNKSFDTGEGYALHHADTVIAAITSCTNTSNPSVLIAAGLLAKKALAKGLKRKPWVKTSFAPGSLVVTRYLELTGLQNHLDQLGFTLVGYGCTTCIGNSGPLPEAVAKTITDNDLIVSAVLSGNRNFEGRIHPQVKANWLASPPLVVAFALTGTMNINLMEEPMGQDEQGKNIFLKDIWPSTAEIEAEVKKITGKMFQEAYADIFKGSDAWISMKVPESKTYIWQENSTYIQHPPFFNNMTHEPEKIQDIQNANILALLGDSVTTDHISPAGSFKANSPAGQYLLAKGVSENDFNSYGSRRGNHEVMMRGTFANIRIKNEMVPEKEGGFTKYLPTGEILSIYDVAMRYQKDKVPLVVIAGKEYGTGSSRDWAAKGPKLLGVKAVIAESFERIHRSNLIGMGILPLEFKEGETRHTLGITGVETIDILGLEEKLNPGMTLKVILHKEDNNKKEFIVTVRIDTHNELEYYKNGGILQYMIRKML